MFIYHAAQSGFKLKFILSIHLFIAQPESICSRLWRMQQ